MKFYTFTKVPFAHIISDNIDNPERSNRSTNNGDMEKKYTFQSTKKLFLDNLFLMLILDKVKKKVLRAPQWYNHVGIGP